ncbi:hypothetical protein R8Z57_13570 [Microbacterium sp. M3]|uniref:Uncharacterized protein n=1 Tax=Microbacterium arthrosphaerae TaxID=792652 RepID=A0ABU4H399_9MICO|nr:MULTISPECIES: hypothetical protein [Microbacterium]MDW4573804.1 hypothetical protein [Microbacterium arthrosphaerae]MDW7607659.1 hypothetical protein [Microbacterium sp. M3]
MESTPSSAWDAPTPLTRRTDPVSAARSWSRSRRARTFGLGALCGGLALSLVVVVTSIFAASADRPPLLPQPAPAAEERPAPRVTPTPTPSPTVLKVAEEPADTVPEPEAEAETVVDPAPAPEPTAVEPPPAAADEAEPAPGNSGSAPGRTKTPKNP